MLRGRSRADGVPYDPNRRDIGSIAVTGFGLAGLCAAAERGWVKQDQARTRVRNGLRFFATDAPQEHGWFFHWMNVKEGRRTGVLENSEKKSELSSIDTALLMGGILTAKGYFHKDAEIQKLATKIYERMDFQWMLDGDPLLLSHGWTPETGFLTARWAKYSEFTIIYLLAIGSPTHPIPAESWYAWERNPKRLCSDTTTLACRRCLRISIRRLLWIIEAGVRRAGRRSTGSRIRLRRRAPIGSSASIWARSFPGYNENIWGITSSNSEKGYKAWGGPPQE